MKKVYIAIMTLLITFGTAISAIGATFTWR